MAIDRNDISDTFRDAQQARGTAEGRVNPEGPGPEDLYAEEGYDESQRSEILEAEGQHPADGTVEIDIAPDYGSGDADDDEIEDDEDSLDTIEDTDEPFRTVQTLGGEEPADLLPDSADRLGIQGNEGDVGRQDTQNVTDDGPGAR